MFVATVRWETGSTGEQSQGTPLITTPETTRKTTLMTTLETTQKILAIIEREPRTTRHVLAASLGMTLDGVKYHLANLRKEGLIRRVGPTKGGHWEIVP